MKKFTTLFITVLGLSGYSALSIGIHLSFGLPAALMASGTLLLIFALRAASISKRG
tara:strand:+ start:19923 stop:20090 length:168 start_codon:yes stop_codon:yes gene_type:complete